MANVKPDCGCDPYLLSLVETKQEQPIATKSGRSVGLFLASVTGGAAIALSVICYPFVSPALRRVVLPYVPASTKQVENVVKVLLNSSGKGKTLIDLGSGDGRIVLAAAKTGFQSHGVELNSFLVLYSKFSAWRQRTSNATFSRQDLFKVDFTKYNNVVIFGVEEMMPELESLFERSLKSSSQVIACRFPLPNWKPSHVIGEGIDTVWVYEV